jgi:hypothetical protein
VSRHTQQALLDEILGFNRVAGHEKPSPKELISMGVHEPLELRSCSASS